MPISDIATLLDQNKVDTLTVTDTTVTAKLKNSDTEEQATVVSNTDVIGFFTIFGKSRGIEKLINKLQCPRANSIYIGDETRDIEAARKVDIKSIAVTWGYNTEKVLVTYKPDCIARKPEDLLMLL